MFIFKKRKPAQVLNDLDAYLSALGTEPIELIGREIQRWGEISYSELEEIIRAGLLDEYLDWQGKYSAFVNETLNPLWTSAFLAAAERATRGKIILSDSDLDVRNWLATRGGEFITSESAASRRAIAAIVAHETENLINPRRLARQIRPLIGLTESQSIANLNYRERLRRELIQGGMNQSRAEAQSERAALRYATSQHRYRAETIAHTELAFAYNRGAHAGVKRAIRQGLMGRCAMIWTTAGTNRVCGRCMDLKDKVVGYTDESGVQIPPLHPRCRCAIRYDEEPALTATESPPNFNSAGEMLRRRQSQDGHEIIDKPTYSKLTRSFIKAGGLIIRGEEAAQHLKLSGASASYVTGANVAFISDEATISDVLEEMYHARQDRAKMFGEITEDLVWLKREIDAQKYLLRVAQKYKIPAVETAVTLENLKRYEELLEARLNER